MDTKIEPALSARDWRQFVDGNPMLPNSAANEELPRYLKQCDHAVMIAKHNYLLRESRRTTL
jgi:hypothetical protein